MSLRTRFASLTAVLAVLASLDHLSALQDREVWSLQESGVTASLRGIHAVSEKCCWASGSEGTVLLTVDGGETWKSVGPPDCAEADFRDIHAWDERSAVIMAAGDPDRLYRTEDGGQSWAMVYEHPDPAAFFDGMVFDQTGQSAWLMGDPLAGRVMLLRTTDAGRTWLQHDPAFCPAIAEGVAGFAASGTNVALLAGGRLVIGMGGGKDPESRALIAIAEDADGLKWELLQSPLAASESSGIFSLALLKGENQRIVAVGGDYLEPDRDTEHVGIFGLEDGAWRTPQGRSTSGYRSAVALATTGGGPVLVATGPGGTDASTDDGFSWRPVSTKGFHTLSFIPGTDIGWAAGSEGRIARWKGAAE